MTYGTYNSPTAAKVAAGEAREKFLSVIWFHNPKTGKYEVRAGRPKKGK